MYKIFLLLFFAFKLFSSDLMLAKVYEDQNISGWLMGEKLDGVRGVWNGKILLSKQGKDLKAPKWFTENFPPFKIEGELWSKRGDFDNIVSIIKSNDQKENWKKLTLNIFDVIEKGLPFYTRVEKAREWFQKHPSNYVNIIEQIPCNNEKELLLFLKEVESKGGEGVIVRDPNALYKEGRSGKILKVKSFFDAEGEVVKINSGKGKFEGLMGSLKLRIKSGKTFNLGSGFTIKQRENPPQVGDVVTFKYKELTRNGIPKFASFMRIRKSF